MRFVWINQFLLALPIFIIQLYNVSFPGSIENHYQEDSHGMAEKYHALHGSTRSSGAAQHNVYCAQHYCLNLIIMIPAQESRLCIGGLEDQTTSLSYLLANHVYVPLPTCGFGV